MFENNNKNEQDFNWILGIPFLKKYRLSFNYDTKSIGYYKNDDKIIFEIKKEENNKYSFFNNSFFKIICIVILVVIFFILGMIYQRKIIKFPRKIKANELEDNYEYDFNKKNDINFIQKNKFQKEVELGFKLIN